MDRARNDYRRAGWLAVLALCAVCGCQTVKTPEEKIAKGNIPREFQKVSMPDYVLEPPDLVIVEVLEALPGRPISGERLVRPDGKISLGFYGDVYVAGLTMPEVKEKIVLHLRKYLTDEVLGLIKHERGHGAGDRLTKTGKPKMIDPKDSDRVFVDVTAYNSKNYYVLGDVLITGKMPITGNETVLDAIQFAGGLMPTAAPQNIRLVRPAPPAPAANRSCRSTCPPSPAAAIPRPTIRSCPTTGSSFIAIRSFASPSSSIVWRHRSRPSSARSCRPASRSGTCRFSRHPCSAPGQQVGERGRSPTCRWSPVPGKLIAGIVDGALSS